MKLEKPEQSKKQSAREIESRYPEQDSSGRISKDFFTENEDALDKAKLLLSLKQAKLILDTDSENVTRALVKNKKKEIIFSTTLPEEIEDLANVAYH